MKNLPNAAMREGLVLCCDGLGVGVYARRKKESNEERIEARRKQLPTNPTRYYHMIVDQLYKADAVQKAAWRRGARESAGSVRKRWSLVRPARPTRCLSRLASCRGRRRLHLGCTHGYTSAASRPQSILLGLTTAWLLIEARCTISSQYLTTTSAHT